MSATPAEKMRQMAAALAAWRAAEEARWGSLTLEESRSWALRYVRRELKVGVPPDRVLEWSGGRTGPDEPGCDAGQGWIVIYGRFPPGVSRIRRYPLDLLGHRWPLAELLAEAQSGQLELFGGAS